MEVEPHVEDRRVQLLGQENKALLRQREQDQMVAERRQRLMESQYNEHLASLTERDTRKYDEIQELLKRAEHRDIAHAAQCTLDIVRCELRMFPRRGLLS